MVKKIDVAEIFGSDVFDDATMKERLPKKIYKELKQTISVGGELDSHVAEVVANAMKDWAIEKGATHYTHWFQPLTGITAEKHDAFISPTDDGGVILEFSGKELIKGEPDGSSFPSGGLRATFEARGYTAWDCTSPAFVHETPSGSTVLCIPTIFCSYTGEALDKKTPLLRSMEALSVQALRIVRAFGDTEAQKVTTSVGPEQEYFLVDRDTYNQREDLIFAGRTLFGAPAPKGQELDDHYFGSIKERVSSYMNDLNEELWKLGVTAKTQHNEVAPAQHELAPIYNTTNIATDHNQLIMETMKKVALRHNLVCLLHEKPFAGINGSGKHNNWSMSTDTGVNLLDPGVTPHQNKQFLLILSAILKAVDEYAPLLRESAANPGNDHRLGANEAPPAIISIFLGEQLEDVLNQLCEKGEATSSKVGGKLDVGVSTVPSFMKDATDRNRTSPFAFTGNKFEFRMVGSTASIADPNTVLNTIVAETLRQAADVLEASDDPIMAAHDLTKKWIGEHIRIIFNGNGYSEEWVEEAERRGLPNIKNMVDALGCLTEEYAVELFERHKVMTRVELTSRQEVGYETYAKAINIEARTMIDMTKKEIIPAVIKYTTTVAQSVAAVKAVGADASVQEASLADISKNLVAMNAALEKLEAATDKAASIEEPKAQAIAYRDEVFTTMSELREPADALEMLVDKSVWPFPTYGDLLFNV
ncbi:glutamine synthetase III [Frisingicoccus caecimuris]|uniref:Glutamine synthetase n=1 Tax=Frisingicoccus caecimuris TaxID=1796636 RepID=A0A4R2LZZ2_9FIRM|nr:glutamine synthetase III [Frisingicoccus caecimuris]MCR1918661.1 glutamine synthetase III [Frisingicoccus caecimuris]TCO86293.1 glutamine synthetase [Frisingicoccus caecimuris]